MRQLLQGLAPLSCQVIRALRRCHEGMVVTCMVKVPNWGRSESAGRGCMAICLVYRLCRSFGVSHSAAILQNQQLSSHHLCARSRLTLIRCSTNSRGSEASRNEQHHTKVSRSDATSARQAHCRQQQCLRSVLLYAALLAVMANAAPAPKRPHSTRQPSSCHTFQAPPCCVEPTLPAVGRTHCWRCLGSSIGVEGSCS
jgi:hypothetical protein